MWNNFNAAAATAAPAGDEAARRETALIDVTRAVLVAAVILSGCAHTRTVVGTRFINPPSLPIPRGYSQIVEVPAGSRLVYISGQVAVDKAGNVVGKGDFRAQAVQVFENLKAALAAADATFADVVKLNYYVLDAGQVQTLRDLRDQYVNTPAPPASTLVEVRRLAREEFLLEVEAVAVVRPAAAH
jgi:enamine deaminase RidA (YjgF/YER057c/UK114 family)